jgi:hypothetical protein
MCEDAANTASEAAGQRVVAGAMTSVRVSPSSRYNRTSSKKKYQLPGYEADRFVKPSKATLSVNTCIGLTDRTFCGPQQS